MSLLLAALFASAPTTSAPSFDCARASSPVERIVCADPALAEADRLLAAVYSKARRTAGMRRDQREWLARRDSCANPACIAFSYEDRTTELMNDLDMPLHYERRGHAGAPGNLSMAPLGDGRHLFRLTALYIYPGGMNANDSLADGMVRIAGGRGVWRDREGCTLTFTRKGRGWRVDEGENCRNGLNVTMGGDYRP